MGTRGRRSAADLCIFRTEGELIPIDLDAMARGYSDTREAVRALRRAERAGTVVCKTGPNGEQFWFQVT